MRIGTAFLESEGLRTGQRRPARSSVWGKRTLRRGITSYIPEFKPADFTYVDAPSSDSLTHQRNELQAPIGRPKQPDFGPVSGKSDTSEWVRLLVNFAPV